MHTTNAVEALELLLAVAERLGYSIRHECLGGSIGASCEIAGRKVMFVDLSLNPIEQLDQVSSALREDPSIHVADLPAEATELLGLKRAA